jgi:hypothetical protein
MSSEPDERKVDSMLAELFPAAEAPSPGAESATLAAVRASFKQRRGPLLVFRLAAAALLLAVGFAAGALLVPEDGNGVEDVPAALADHERTVFETVRESLGEDLRWLASSGGEVLVGLSPVATDRPLRVVFVETRSESGEWLARTRVVLPEDEPVRVAFPGAPAVELTARDAGAVACAVEFPDGSRIESAGSGFEPGKRRLLGQVRTDGRTVSVFVAAF